MKKSEYELMIIIHQEISSRCPDGIDEESCTVGSGTRIIKWLLQNDIDLKGYKLVKKIPRNKKEKA